MLSCPTSDVTNRNPIVQLLSITGTLKANTLKVVALDSEKDETFTGSLQSPLEVNRTFSPTADITTFAASSQYYVTLSSDPANPAQNLAIAYRCANTTWFLSGAGATESSGAGSHTAVSAVAATFSILIFSLLPLIA